MTYYYYDDDEEEEEDTGEKVQRIARQIGGFGRHVNEQANMVQQDAYYQTRRIQNEIARVIPQRRRRR